MSKFHKVTGNEREQQAEDFVEAMIVSLAASMDMSLPSAVYMVQQITCRHLAGWSKPATIQTLRNTARYINGDTKYSKFFQDQERLFDEITAQYERQNGFGGRDQ